MSSALCYRCQHRMLVASHRLFLNPPRQSRRTHAESPQPQPKRDYMSTLVDDVSPSDTSPRLPKAVESQKRPISTEDQHLQDLFKSAGDQYPPLTAEGEKLANDDNGPSTRAVKMGQGSWDALVKGQKTSRNARFKKQAGNVPLTKHGSSTRFQNSQFRSLVANAPDLDELKTLWRGLELRGAREKQEPTIRFTRKHSEPNLAAHIDVTCYEALIRAFAAYGEFAKMWDVWEALLQSGKLIPAHTWATLMRGISRSRDWKKFEAVWQEAIAQGLVADEQMWICRLRLLVKNRQWRLATEALSTFHGSAAEAIPAPSRVSHNKIKPINLVNPILRELLRLGQHDDVKEIFTWAESVGFKANTITINQFIHAASQEEGGLKAGLRALDAFRQRNLAPDAATISILLKAFTRQEFSCSEMSHEDQQMLVMEILTELEKRGLETKYTYTILISFLCANTNFEATRHVVAHMKARQVEPSLEACTSIATCYLNQDPIDFTALDELLEDMRSRDQTPDPRFCWRLIAGYADAAKIGKMMSVLQESERRGFFPQFDVLQKVFDTLEAANEFDILHQFTTDAVHLKGIFRNYDPRRHGRGTSFWDSVDGFREKGFGADSL